MLFDTSAWIEYIQGTSNGPPIAKILKEKPCFTSQISLAELSSWLELNKLNSPLYLEFIKSQSRIIPLSDYTLEEAGKIHCEKRKKIKDFGMIDAIILRCAQENSLQLVTKDKHFKEENVMMLK